MALFKLDKLGKYSVLYAFTGVRWMALWQG